MIPISGSSPESGLPEARIAELLIPYLQDTPVPPGLYRQLSQFLELLLRWNSRTNLTAIRNAEEIVRRHFGESLFAARQLQSLLRPGDSLLDFGSGAGFPGVPIQLLLPRLYVTLAESQGKKSAFLHEVTRALQLPSVIWPKRVELLPSQNRFHAVSLRAVDHMQAALEAACRRVLPGGYLVVLGTGQPVGEKKLYEAERTVDIALPGLKTGRLIIEQLS